MSFVDEECNTSGHALDGKGLLEPEGEVEADSEGVDHPVPVLVLLTAPDNRNPHLKVGRNNKSFVLQFLINIHDTYIHVFLLYASNLPLPQEES